MTDWCVQDRASDPSAVDDLVAVIDAGRALVLRTATSGRTVADELAARGFTTLAQEWRATRGLGRNRLTGTALSGLTDAPEDGVTLPDELRVEALRALGGDGDVIGLRPVTVPEIQTALRTTGTDALVHLLPANGSGSGLAVIVPTNGGVVVRDLPALRADLAPAVPALTDTRDAHVVGTAPGHGDLDQLCAWAWTAAIGDVLRFTARRYRRTARLVLIPFGTLALVPWHAAFAEDNGGRRYALEEAVFSYSPSARVFCDGAAHVPAPVRSSLVVGDPNGDLRFAGIEAQAIHQRFYPSGTYLGRTATPRAVLDWIDSSPTGPSMLHFACHATIERDRPADAHLLLAGGVPLTAGELIDHTRSAALGIEQVFLAACTTSAAGSHHDEVLNLATSFLAAGAHTVYGSLWPVPDTETSLLMYMVHWYLRVEGCGPADALHRAQRWMLDPRREPPPGMPAELRGQCRHGGYDTVAWAGFTHYGR